MGALLTSTALLSLCPWSLRAGGLYEGCKSFSLTDSRNMTATYDLSAFNLEAEVFQVTDSGNRNFVYDFNVCGAIDAVLFASNTTIPHQCAHPADRHGPCIEWYSGADSATGSAVPVCKTFAPTTGQTPSAVQVEHYGNVTRCYWLGMGVDPAANLAEYERALLDPDDAGKGVVFSILNGEWCPTVGRNRELRVKLQCPDDPRIEVEPGSHRHAVSTSEVDEVATCVYELAVQTPLACPSKCVSPLNLGMFAVCATHGICEADPFANGEEQWPRGHLRCLCDDGWNGTVCQEQLSELTYIDRTHPGLLAAIVVCIVLLGVAIVCSAVLCHKIRMRELETSRSADMRGMLADAADANLAQTKADAMTMDIGARRDSPKGVRLQTIDNQLETDRDDEVERQPDGGGDDREDGAMEEAAEERAHSEEENDQRM